MKLGSRRARISTKMMKAHVFEENILVKSFSKTIIV